MKIEKITYPNDPICTTDSENRYDGLTKREYFAAMAMQGILSSRGLQEAINSDRQSWENFAVEMADNLIKELNKGGEDE